MSEGKFEISIRLSENTCSIKAPVSLGRRPRVLLPYVGVIQESTHAAGFFPLYRYQEHVAPDVIAVLKTLHRRLVQAGI